MERDWRLQKSSLQESFGHIFATGSFADVAFLVGPERFRINAHKTILCARSETFAAMFHDRWTSDKTQEKPIPKNNKSAFKPFLNYLYTDNISFGELEIDDILEITHLAHMYQVHQLLKECSKHLTNNIDASNCMQIYKSCKVLDKKLSDKALEYFLANIVPTAKCNNAYLAWDADIVEKILLDDREHVPETILFKALLNWKNQEPERNTSFVNLLKLIRFPTMTSKEFAAQVVTTDVLSKDDKLDVLSYIAMSSGSVKFPTKSRNVNIRANADTSENADFKTVNVFDAEVAVTVGTLSPRMNSSASCHKLSMSIRPMPLSRKTVLKLYGVKLFAPQPADVNFNGVLAFLKSIQWRVTVTVSDSYKRIIGTVSKTIRELEQLGFRVYFTTPVNLIRNGFSITTELEEESPVGAGLLSSLYLQMGRFYNHSSTADLVTSEGETYKFTFQNMQGLYGLIHELIFSPPGALSDSTGDCNIS